MENEKENKTERINETKDNVIIPCLHENRSINAYNGNRKQWKTTCLDCGQEIWVDDCDMPE